MSHKYQELVKKYAAEIASLKRAKARLDEAQQKFNSFKPGDNIQDYSYSEELSDEWEQANQGYQIEASQLTHDIDAEYWDVPFAKARTQGIEKFWELAGF